MAVTSSEGALSAPSLVANDPYGILRPVGQTPEMTCEVLGYVDLTDTTFDSSQAST